MKNTVQKIQVLIALCLAVFLFSQKRVEDFTISLPDQKLEKSYYKTITLIDNRIDTTSLGIVQKGAFNTKARVVPRPVYRISFRISYNTSMEPIQKKAPSSCI
ncbi:hypothetical protein [Chryseobacterium carnipullorum]|uniref:Uncharacterized protein n=1 Tax=Chryseobacterium carnipullorum TaxID=1124835 RepID=A0A376DME7_CHRCU|nr:hypothetical protein [Chryseobacterium carnipullorum]STC91571.1 Uncharacterised protein [Chryseobacterium carnipullorum]